MKITIEKAPDPEIKYVWCNNPNCPINPKYHFKIEEWNPSPNNYLIKQDTIMASILLRKHSFHKELIQCYYCTDCIDDLYQEMKISLNKKLWAFK
jgi:hypothetical protein